MGRPKGSKNKTDLGIYLKCLCCGNKFRVRAYRKDTAKFCSQSCLAKHNYPLYLEAGFTMKGKVPYNKKYTDRKECRREYERRNIATPKGKLNRYFSTYINESLKGNKNNIHWEKLVGYSISTLMAHIEKQFAPGMTWENHNRYGWHIEHKIPISAFNFNSPQDIDFRRCWALSNLRPMWAKENLKKKNKVEGQFQPALAVALYFQDTRTKP